MRQAQPGATRRLADKKPATGKTIPCRPLDARVGVEFAPAFERQARAPSAKRQGREESAMAQQGIVKFFNPDKGYGFIKPDDGGRDIFVHITAVEQAGLASLNEGQKITFEVEPDKKGKGPKAVNLQVG